MVRLITQLILVVPIILLVLINLSIAQDNCKVLLDAIAGQYEGDCRKGLAEGKGTAKGEDMYVGAFKKGLPHGVGKYTWANGDIYEGEFKKGLKEGKGSMSILLPDGQATEQTGYWSNDKYMGENKSPYKMHYRSMGVLSVRINEAENTDDEEPALLIETLHKGKPVPNPEFALNEITGNYQSKFSVGMGTKVLVTTFPFRFTIGYLGESVDIEIYQATSWNISIDYNK